MCINWGLSACAQPARSYAHQLNPEFLQERPGLKARVVDGKKMASTIHSEVAAEVNAMVQKGQRSVGVGGIGQRGVAIPKGWGSIKALQGKIQYCKSPILAGLKFGIF